MVHDALEMMFWLPSYASSLTPRTVMSSSVAGAEMITFLAPSRWLASAALVNRPVLVRRRRRRQESPHGNAAGLGPGARGFSRDRRR